MFGCWASALPDSKANPSATIADNMIMMKESRMDIAVSQFLASSDTTQEMGRE